MGTPLEGDRPWQSYNTVYTNAKAGMDGVDKEKVQRTVYEMSKGSKYFENEQRKEELIKQKIEILLTQIDKLTDKDISHFQNIANKRILELEASRDLSKIWLHVDMDAFYAAVETLEDPSLRGKPMAVGGMSMISTANYEARKFGVRAAMPGFIACKLCPDLIFAPLNFEKYTSYSELTRKVFRRYDPDFISTSLDEAYLDITDVCINREISSDEVAVELRNAVFEETGLTCSAGVAPNFMLAKVCSDIKKPNGQFILPNDKNAIMAFISSLPVRKIGGIGNVTEHVLRDALGVKTCEDMLQKSAFICALYTSCSSGRTDTPEQKARKSISSERTFRSTNNEIFLFQKLGEIAESLSTDMQKQCLSGRSLTLKLKTAAFEVRTRAVSLKKCIQSREDILSCASKILKAELPLSLRLIGLRMSQFDDDKHNPVDRMQKTIVGFLSGGNSNPNDRLSNKQAFLETSDKFEVHVGLDFSKAPSAQDVEFESSASEDHIGERQHDKLTLVCKSHHSCSEEFKSTKPMETNEPVNFVEKLIEQVGLMWLDDYICSVCGIELPPSFIDERREHSDYHLAEMIQKEESSHSGGNLAQEERMGTNKYGCNTSYYTR